MAHILSHLADFEKILTDYQIPAGNSIVSSTKLVLFFGATASGRDALINELVKTGAYRHLVSNTTRPQRNNNGVPEQNGVEYWFRTEEEMLDDLRQGNMLEAEVIHDQQVSGISLAELKRASEQHKVAITNVELNIVNIVKAKPDTTSIMVLPPSFSENLRRLNSRGTLTPHEIGRRLRTAKSIYQAGLDWDFFKYVVNDDLTSARKQVEAIVYGKVNSAEQAAHRQHVEELLADTVKWLEENQN